MATKDWKTRDKNTWFNGKTDESLWIQKFNDVKVNKWFVFVNPGIKLRAFKTRSQALRFAKSYRSKH